MKPVIQITLLLKLFSMLSAFSQSNYAVVLHGGADVLSREMMSAEQQEEYFKKLEVAHHKPDEPGGTGGVITLDIQGKIAMNFNSDGMFPGYIKSNGDKFIGIFKNE